MAEKKGTVKWFSALKGYGFITPEDGSEDLFVYKSAVKSHSLGNGDLVQYTVEFGNDGRRRAANVTLDGGRSYGGGGAYNGGGGGYGGVRGDLSSKAVIDSSCDVLTVTAEEKEKVCIIVNMNGDMGVFLLNPDQDQDGADANGFVDILPHFRVSANPAFCVLKAKLYAIDDDICHSPPQVYSFDLQSVSASVKDAVLDIKTDFTKCCDCLGPKLKLQCLPYRDSILAFSAAISYHYYDAEDGDKYVSHMNLEDPNDFELYSPEAQGCVLLPQLIVCRPLHGISGFKLYHPDSKKYYEEFSAFGGYGSFSTFGIVSFGLDVEEDKFIIQTEFGTMLSLKLDGTDDRWRLCEEGYEFLYGCKNIVTSNGVCLNAFGASDSRTRWLKQQQQRRKSRRIQSDEDGDGRKRAAPSSHMQFGRVSFPPTDREINKCGLIIQYEPDSSAFDLHKLNGDPSCTRICIVRQAFDYVGARYERSSKLYLWLNVLQVDLKQLANDDHKDDDKIVKRLKSFKYAVPESIDLSLPYVEGLFYY